MSDSTQQTTTVNPIQSAVITHIGLCAHYNEHTSGALETSCAACPSFTVRNCPLRMLLASMNNITAWEPAPKCN